MNNTLDKAKVLDGLKSTKASPARREYSSLADGVEKLIEAIEEGRYDSASPTVTLGDGSVATVGDVVLLDKSGQQVRICAFDKRYVWCQYLTGLALYTTELPAYLRALPEPDSWEALEGDIAAAILRFYISPIEGDKRLARSAAQEIVSRAKVLAERGKL
jgi:hypothetical protein